METQFEQVGKNQAQLDFEFTVEEFKGAMEASFKKNAGRFDAPGFRKGKVPMGIALRYYGESTLYDDAIDYLFADAYGDAIDEYGIQPVSQPELSIEEIGLEKGMKVRMLVDTRPVPVLGQYKGVEAVKVDVEVSEEEVLQELKNEQDRNARLVPVVDRPAEEGDTTSIDFEGFMNDEPFEGGKGEDFDLELGSGSFIPGFEDQIVGHEAGDEFDVNITFPEDYGAEELAGEEAVFKVRLNNIKKRELPELDDEFAKDISEFDTIDEYKESIRERLITRKEHDAGHQFEDNVLNAIVDNVEIDIPHSMIHQQMDQMFNHQDQQMRQQGFSLSDYLGMMGQDESAYKDTLHEPAERQIAIALTLEAIGNAEGIELTDEEKDEEITRLAGQTGLTEEQVRQQIAGQEDQVMRNALDRKIIDFLTENARPVPPPAVEETDEDAVEEAVEVDENLESADSGETEEE